MEREIQRHETSGNLKISVILAVCNQICGIKRCIRSLREQALPKIEMIFADNCGIDNTIKKISDVEEDPCILPICNVKNSEPTFLCKDGIESVTDEYLQFTNPGVLQDAKYIRERYRFAYGKDLDSVKDKQAYELADDSQKFNNRANTCMKKKFAREYPLFNLLTQHKNNLTRRCILMKYHIYYGNYN